MNREEIKQQIAEAEAKVIEAKTQLHAFDKALWEDEYAKKIKKQQEFKAKLFEEHGVEENQKAQRCWELAWDYGHSSGLNEVGHYFNELVELIK